MARIRTIKPDFWEDEKVGQLPIPCRLFFIGCWNFADDYGVIKGNAALLKSQIFPYDENLRVSEIKKWIDALVNARMLIPIIHVEESYYIIRTFRSHQVLDNRYSKSYISKDKSLVSRIVDESLNNNIVSTSSTQCVHNVTTTEEKEMEKEEKENISKEISKKEGIDLKFALPSFVPVLQEWLDYKTERKEKYTEKGFRAFYGKLTKLSNNNADIAQLIIQESMANNWAGIFPLKNNEQQRTQNNSRVSSKPSFNNYDEAEARHVGKVESFEF